MELLNALNWRYATKKMNGNKVDQTIMDKILEAARLAPTSSGLQPYEVIVITNPELKIKIQQIAMGQTQIVDCSHLLVFAAWDNYTKERIHNRFDFTLNERGLPLDTMDDYRNRLIGLYTPREAEENFIHTARQAYIGFGMAIAAAAELKVDATPMEGFDNAALDELLDLKEKGLRSVTLLPIGYRDAENDWLVNQKKVRVALKDFVTELN
ncbi:NAD(P)H-dependent oxidoreductase [Arachidicoccus soli]|uniref:NAD(P)H-dependent oxidoreductase n=1 Tax=Arachidicoccus soli TaxID=2341117 RepID=A0A386HMJ6_9BACT|nr:NAD(P)H-dependent oxidoreductase [Arachidicoccus soli]AYD46750.1 NAD(P)H-dependent oxidoreductase [Arachidicoccus soli]